MTLFKGNRYLTFPKNNENMPLYSQRGGGVLDDVVLGLPTLLKIRVQLLFKKLFQKGALAIKK